MIKTVWFLLALSKTVRVEATELPQIDGIDENSVMENYNYASIVDEIDQIVNGSGVVAEKSILPGNSSLDNSLQWNFPPLPEAAEDSSQTQESGQRTEDVFSLQNKEITVYRRNNLLNDLNNRNKTEKPHLPELNDNTDLGALKGITDIKGLVRE